MTGQQTTRYRQPIRIGQPTVATSTIVRDRGRALELRAAIRDRETQRVLAEATATFIRVPEAQATAWLGQYGTSDTEQGSARE